MDSCKHNQYLLLAIAFNIIFVILFVIMTKMINLNYDLCYVHVSVGCLDSVKWNDGMEWCNGMVE